MSCTEAGPLAEGGQSSHNEYCTDMTIDEPEWWGIRPLREDVSASLRVCADDREYLDLITENETYKLLKVSGEHTSKSLQRSGED